MSTERHGGELSAATRNGLGLSEELSIADKLLARWKSLGVAALVAGSLGFGGSYLVTPTYMATAVFIPPQQQSGGAAAALASLGALSSLVGGSTGRTSTDQYVALMQSVTVSDRIIGKFKLLDVYDEKYIQDGRKKLGKRVQIAAGRKDGLIRVDVEDTSQQRAADIANQYIDELRLLTSRIAVTEAQQRRVFFETQLKETKAQLVSAQLALENSGINPGALKAEPRSAADGYARLKAELTAAKVKLDVLKGSLANSATEVVQQTNTVRALGQQLAQLESTQSTNSASANYVGSYREYKYQETLFDLFAKQYELARIDESREGALIQVVDKATPPEKKHKPGRAIYALLSALAGVALVAVFSLVRHGRAE